MLLNILTLVGRVKLLQLKTIFSCLNVVLALPILTLTSASVPPCVSMVLPRYVKQSTSSRFVPSRVIGVLLDVFILRTLLFSV